MTDEQINAAIARECGWKSKEETNGIPWMWVRTGADGRGESTVNAPNYCTDLNAMHEAEKVILPKFSHFYANKLALITGVDCSDEPNFFCATVRQRAEAFLRTLGKWESTTEDSSADGSIS
jgi:hypothetical protein